MWEERSNVGETKHTISSLTSPLNTLITPTYTTTSPPPCALPSLIAPPISTLYLFSHFPIITARSNWIKSTFLFFLHLNNSTHTPQQCLIYLSNIFINKPTNQHNITSSTYKNMINTQWQQHAMSLPFQIIHQHNTFLSPPTPTVTTLKTTILYIDRLKLYTSFWDDPAAVGRGWQVELLYMKYCGYWM